MSFLKGAKMPFLGGKICPLQGLFCPLPAFGEAPAEGEARPEGRRPYGRQGLGFPIK